MTIPFHHDLLEGPATLDNGEGVTNEREQFHRMNNETKINRACMEVISITRGKTRRSYQKVTEVQRRWSPDVPFICKAIYFWIRRRAANNAIE